MPATTNYDKVVDRLMEEYHLYTVDAGHVVKAALMMQDEENARLRREVEDSDLLLGDAWQRVRKWTPDGELDVLETLRQQITKLAGDNAVANQRIEELEGALREIQNRVDKQAEDDGLWFMADYCSEAYLQKGLRDLHSEIEKHAHLIGRKDEDT